MLPSSTMTPGQTRSKYPGLRDDLAPRLERGLEQGERAPAERHDRAVAALLLAGRNRTNGPKL
jgi:hypothetical protein